jgi:hypothetical protein
MVFKVGSNYGGGASSGLCVKVEMIVRLSTLDVLVRDAARRC